MPAPPPAARLGCTGLADAAPPPRTPQPIARRRRVPTAPSLHGPYSCRPCLRDQPECHMMLYACATIADKSLTSFFSPPHLIFFSLPISSPPSSCTSSFKENRRSLTAPGGLAAQRWSSWIQHARPRQRSAAPARAAADLAGDTGRKMAAALVGRPCPRGGGARRSRWPSCGGDWQPPTARPSSRLSLADGDVLE